MAAEDKNDKTNEDLEKYQINESNEKERTESIEVGKVIEEIVENKEAEEAEEGDQKVGYKNPPRHSRFRKGESGNPDGRRRGSRNKAKQPDQKEFDQYILKEGHRKINIYDGKKYRSVEAIEGVIRKQKNKALQGDQRAAALFIRLFKDAKANTFEKKKRAYETSVEYIAKHHPEVVKERAKGRLRPYDCLPHPDDIDIDLASGEALILGPMSESEIPVFEAQRARLLVINNMLDACRDDVPQEMVERLLKAKKKIEEVLSPRWSSFDTGQSDEPYPRRGDDLKKYLE